MNRLARTEASPTLSVHFCTHCGTLSHEPRQRVCGSCGLGVVLACAPGVLLRAGAAFLVVKSDLRVSAASVGVERLLGDPDELIGQSLLAVLSGDPALARWIGRAAMGSQRVVSVALRIGARRVTGRIAGCGDPPAALVILE
jgi:hypothetical protein